MSFWQKLGIGLKKSSAKLTGGITDIFTKRRLDTATLEELEDLLLSADLGYPATQRIMKDFAAQRQNKDITEIAVRKLLAQDIEAIIKPCEQPLILGNEKPQIILMVGVNGAGKTTTIGKLAAKLTAQGKKVSFIAADTFRAAAVEQLKIWAERNNLKIFSGPNGCDSAGLCYDGINAAIKNGDDVVFIDTAGRLQNKSALMDELKKIIKVIQKIIPQAPHHTLLTIDATTGQNAVEQVKIFKQDTGVSGLVITKLDGSAKGGILAAIAEESPVPVHYIGVGEQIEDLDVFSAHDYARQLLDLPEEPQ